jgi:hypothetical protein
MLEQVYRNFGEWLATLNSPDMVKRGGYWKVVATSDDKIYASAKKLIDSINKIPKGWPAYLAYTVSAPIADISLFGIPGISMEQLEAAANGIDEWLRNAIFLQGYEFIASTEEDSFWIYAFTVSRGYSIYVVSSVSPFLFKYGFDTAFANKVRFTWYLIAPSVWPFPTDDQPPPQNSGIELKLEDILPLGAVIGGGLLLVVAILKRGE